MWRCVVARDKDKDKEALWAEGDMQGAMLKVNRAVCCGSQHTHADGMVPEPMAGELCDHSLIHSTVHLAYRELLALVGCALLVSYTCAT